MEEVKAPALVVISSSSGSVTQTGQRLIMLDTAGYLGFGYGKGRFSNQGLRPP